MTASRTSTVMISFIVAATLTLGACGNPSKEADSTSTTNAGATSTTATTSDGTRATTKTTSAGATSTADGGQSSSASMPSTGCLLTDEQASQLLGEEVHGSSVGTPTDGMVCTYGSSSGDAAISVSAKPYPSPEAAQKLVHDLQSDTAHMYVNSKAIDVGDGGAIGDLGSLSYGRFTVGDIFVEITLRPADASKVEQAASWAEAALGSH